METVVTTLKERRNNRRKKAKEEVKIEDLETANASKEDHSKEEESVSIDSSRYPFLFHVTSTRAPNIQQRYS